MRLFGFEPFVGKGIMCTDGIDWALYLRALIKPTFARTKIADLHLAAYANHAENVIRLIPCDGTTVDLQPLFARLALGASTEFLFGESVGTPSTDTMTDGAQAFLQAYQLGHMVVGKRFHLPQWNILTHDREFQEACNIAHSFVDGYIAKAREAVRNEKVDSRLGKIGTIGCVLAHDLIKETEDHVTIRNQLLNVFLLAHEATGGALTNVFFTLARHPNVYARLHKEVVELAKSRDIWTFEGLKSLKYLQYVINETFRFNPAIATNTRMALRDIVLPVGGGQPSGFGTSTIYVRKGDIISTSFYALHRRKDLFGEDADSFKLERWETIRRIAWSHMTSPLPGPATCAD